MLLTGKQKRFLRGLGHGLKATIMVGRAGLGDSVLAQIESGLSAHELVKVKVQKGSPLEAAQCAEQICTATGAGLAQKIGHTLLLYKPHPESPVLRLPESS